MKSSNFQNGYRAISWCFWTGTIIGDGDRNEVPFTIARATPCEVRFGLFLAQIAPSLQDKKRALHANLRLDLDKLAGPRNFQMPVLLKKKTKNDL